jgi:small nuclear ribonucleoprotein
MPVPPASVLEKVVQQPVRIRLKDGRDVSGKLMGIDEHLNLVLDDTEETNEDVKRRLGRIVLRGSAIVELRSEGVGGTARPA